MAKKRKKPKMEFRYYQMPAGSPILALLGQKWVQNYGNDVDYLHFHNYLEIGFCYEGDGVMAFGEAKMRFSGREFTVIPPNYANGWTAWSSLLYVKEHMNGTNRYHDKWDA